MEEEEIGTDIREEDFNQGDRYSYTWWLKIALLVFFYVMLLAFTSFMFYMLWKIKDGNISVIAENQLVTVFLALFLALFIVLFLPLTTGKIDFKFWKLEVSGASGPILLWILVFSALMVFGFSPPW